MSRQLLNVKTFQTDVIVFISDVTLTDTFSVSESDTDNITQR